MCTTHYRTHFRISINHVQYIAQRLIIKYVKLSELYSVIGMPSLNLSKIQVIKINNPFSIFTDSYIDNQYKG